MIAPIEQIENLLGIEVQFFKVGSFSAFEGGYDWGFITVKEAKFDCNCRNYGNVCCHVDALKAHFRGIRDPRATIKKVVVVG